MEEWVRANVGTIAFWMGVAHLFALFVISDAIKESKR